MKKKKVIVYGNCHANNIALILKQINEFTEEYEMIEVKPVFEINDVSYFDTIDFKSCDLFIHQAIRKNNRYGEEFSSERIIERLSKDCRIIAIPNVYHLPQCFFPQYTEEKEFKFKNGITAFFRDEIIDELYKKGYSDKKIAELYVNHEFYDVNSIKKEYENFIEKVKLREKDWNIKVVDFIERECVSSKLFYDPNHPTNYFFKYIVKELLTILDIKYNEKCVDEIKVIDLDTYEMPITTQVRKVLNMTFEEEEIRKTGAKILIERMYIKQYVKQYTAFEWQNDELDYSLKKKSKRKYVRYIFYNYFKKAIYKVERCFRAINKG